MMRSEPTARVVHERWVCMCECVLCSHLEQELINCPSQHVIINLCDYLAWTHCKKNPVDFTVNY